jgi:predicted lysophospholipase L1 biosynthesis ABC-type transport system permease subunit
MTIATPTNRYLMAALMASFALAFQTWMPWAQVKISSIFWGGVALALIGKKQQP